MSKIYSGQAVSPFLQDFQNDQNAYAKEVAPTSSATIYDYIAKGRGQLTLSLEGNNNPQSNFFSRRASQPSPESGVTIGRGYDLRFRSSEEIYGDLIAAKVSEQDALILSEAAGLKGQAAKKFVSRSDLPTLSEVQEYTLFNIAYGDIEADVIRISNKGDCVEKYGKVDWENLDPAIKEVLIDLRYRGDYTPETRKYLQKAVSDNDPAAFLEAISKKEIFSSNLPNSRFEARVNHMIEALNQLSMLA